MTQFSVSIAGEPPEVAPVRSSLIASEFPRERSRGRGAQFLRQRPRMLQPGLKIPGRCFHDERRAETGGSHTLDGIEGQVVHKAEIVLALRPDIDIPALLVLKPEP